MKFVAFLSSLASLLAIVFAAPEEYIEEAAPREMHEAYDVRSINLVCYTIFLNALFVSFSMVIRIMMVMVKEWRSIIMVMVKEWSIMKPMIRKLLSTLSMLILPMAVDTRSTTKSD